ncbi:MAG: hypothetical protein WBP03_02110 [Candidatus Saccharimonadales bacterium]
MKRFTRLFLCVVTVLGLYATIVPGQSVSAKSAAPAVCPSGWKYLQVSDGVGGTEENDHVCCPDGSQNTSQDCMMAKYVNPLVKVLGALAGVAVIIGIIMGAIQYASSGGDPQKSAAGKGKIVKSIYGLVTFLFLFGIMQFLSPGGLGVNSITPSGSNIAAQCSKPFLGIKPWFAYLPDSAFGAGSCDITNFALFGDAQNGTGSYVLPVALAISDALLRIIGFVAVGFVMVGGIKYVTSQGEPDKTKQARETIINALAGLAIAIIAASVVTYIGNRLA